MKSFTLYIPGFAQLGKAFLRP